MYWIVNVSDRYLITYFYNIDMTGGYAVVYATASGLSIFSMAIGTVLFPDLSALRKMNKTEEYRQRLSTVLKYFFVISVPATVGLMVIADRILLLLSSTAISKYTDLMYILAPTMLAYGMFNILIQSLISDGRSRTSAIIWATIAILNLGANLVLIPTYAATGASIATFGSFLIGLTIVILWKRSDILIPIKVIGKVIFASVLMGAILTLIQSMMSIPGILALPVVIGIGVIIYAYLGILSGFLFRKDILFVMDSIRD
jgi:O-antigen/teichoic acid export membrane protein